MSDIQQTPDPGTPDPLLVPPAPAAAWPPAPDLGYSNTETVNTSGQKLDVPPEVAKFQWNWGAFMLTWIWCFNHGLPLYAIAFLSGILLGWIPIVGTIWGLALFVGQIVLGLNGHKLAWQNRRFEGGFDQFIAVERAWSKWGIGLFVASFLILPILAAILFPVFAKAREKAREHALETPIILHAVPVNGAY